MRDVLYFLVPVVLLPFMVCGFVAHLIYRGFVSGWSANEHFLRYVKGANR
jgi:hypothetical protein